MSGNEELTRRFTAVSEEILRQARAELYVNMRFLDLALSGLAFSINTELPAIGTDGFSLFVHPKVLVDLYEKDRWLVNRIYLHSVLHCLFRHILKPGREPELLWRISCDMAVEFVMDGIYARSIRTGMSRFRKNWQEDLQRECKVLTAEGIYKALLRRRLSPYELTRLKEEFCTDDHSLWPGAQDPNQPKPPQVEQLQKKWDDISDKTQTEMETFSKEASEGAGDLLNEVRVENRKREDYRGFLRKFAVLREEMQVDMDSFDYVFYTYGLSLYKNMPLIEPQEFREVKRIQEFVIVVDVSMSTSGDLVRNFLEQTYSVLTESETWMKKVHIRILQSDEAVRDDVRITSKEELDAYMEHFTLQGGGGTDFRPAFDYVEKLMEAGEFQSLKGMIYFTDGYGTYPKRRPPFDAAFVFMEEDYFDAEVPPWAIKLIVEKEDFEPAKKPLTDYSFIWEEEQN